MLQPQQTQRIVVVALALVALMSAALFYVDQQTGASVSASRQMVDHTYVVERAFETLNHILEDAESGQRGYLLTGDVRHLKSYEETREKADRQIAHLRSITTDNAAHQQRVERLAMLATRKLTQLEGTVGLMAEGRKDEALLSVESGAGDALMIDIQALSSEARFAELATLAERQRVFNSALQRRSWLRRLLMVSSFGLTLAAFYFVVRLQRLESFATMCAWSRTIQLDGKWVTFEEYLSQRFNVRVSHGIAPRELEKLLTQIEREEEDTGPQPVPTTKASSKSEAA